MNKTSLPRLISLALTALWLLVGCQEPSAVEQHYQGRGKYFGPERPTDQQGLVDDQPQKFRSQHLSADILVPVGVYDPTESELEVLPFLKENKALIKDKEVLEIGTGSGIISLFTATAGAKKVIASDTNPIAISAVQANALSLGLKQVEARLVEGEDLSAYAPLAAGERFDLIISNPPWVFNLDSEESSAVEETGNLGFSILDQLPERLRPGGKAILFYNTFYAHQVMVKSARARGFAVRHHSPTRMMPWEAEALFNSYSQKISDKAKVERATLDFRWQDELELATIKLDAQPAGPLVSGNSNRQYEGMIVLSLEPK